MKWKKLGVLFCPESNYDWMWSHSSNPVVEALEDSLYRIYFSCRDKANRSSIGYFEFDIRYPEKLLFLSKNPLVSPGRPGLFDDSGASMGSLVSFGTKKYLYYTGWNLSVLVPWRNSIGLSVSNGKKLEFIKYSVAPVIDRSEIDPYSVSYPWVIYDENIWKMWYGSNLHWGENHQDMEHVIKYAQSIDGIHWDRKGDIAIPLQLPGEWGVSKPCVLKENGIYRMWYSSRRGDTYRIGYAESSDGIRFIRKDDVVGIDVSRSDWDSQMIEYPCVFDHNNQRYMLYNGNGYGRTGVGWAVLEQD